MLESGINGESYMFIVDKKGIATWKGGYYWPHSSKAKSITAKEIFERGTDLLEKGYVDDALFCFEQAKRLGHEKAEHAIQICKNNLLKL
jgi:hypothetical protein